MEIQLNTNLESRKIRAKAWQEKTQKCPTCGELLKNCPCNKEKK